MQRWVAEGSWINKKSQTDPPSEISDQKRTKYFNFYVDPLLSLSYFFASIFFLLYS